MVDKHRYASIARFASTTCMGGFGSCGRPFFAHRLRFSRYFVQNRYAKSPLWFYCYNLNFPLRYFYPSFVQAGYLISLRPEKVQHRVIQLSNKSIPQVAACFNIFFYGIFFYGTFNSQVNYIFGLTLALLGFIFSCNQFGR